MSKGNTVPCPDRNISSTNVSDSMKRKDEKKWSLTKGDDVKWLTTYWTELQCTTESLLHEELMHLKSVRLKNPRLPGLGSGLG